MLALADSLEVLKEPEQNKPQWTRFGETIPVGQRNGTLISFAAAMLTKYGICDKSHEVFMQRAAQCEEPMPGDEIEKIWSDACGNYKENIAAKPGYVPPDKYLAEEFAEYIEPQDYTDVGQAHVLINQYGCKLRYSPATKWLVYDGKRWNESELKAQRLAQELTDRQLKQARRRLRAARKELDTATETGNEDRIRAANLAVASAESYRFFVLGRRKSNRIAATLTEARPAVEIAVSDLDSDGFLLNTPAGTVDLRTGKMRPHDPNDHITKMTAVSPSFEGIEIWLEFLERLTMGDGDLQEYLQISSGMEAVGNVYLEKIMLAYGSGGNGKSTYYNSKAWTLGDYSGCLSAEILTVNSRKNKSPEYSELRGKRLVIAAELEEGMRLDTAVVKNLCSIDPIQAEKKYKDPFHFRPSHTTVLYTNHLPKVGTIDSGTWDRLVVIPFNARFRGEQSEVLNYADYLFKHCGGAILSWIIEGARKFIAAKFHIREPECVKSAIAQYHADNDWLDHFLADRCEIDSYYSQRSGELYAQYKNYCDSTGEYRRSLVDFKRPLSAAGFETRKTMYGAVVYGLRLLSDFAHVDEPASLSEFETLTS